MSDYFNSESENDPTGNVMPSDLPTKEEIDAYLLRPDFTTAMKRLLEGKGDMADQRMAVLALYNAVKEAKSLKNMQMLVEALGAGSDVRVTAVPTDILDAILGKDGGKKGN